MAGSPKGQLSLDTNLPLDLAEPQDFAHEFREEFQRRGYVLRLAPTVLAELEYLILFVSLAAKGTGSSRRWLLANSVLGVSPRSTCRRSIMS